MTFNFNNVYLTESATVTGPYENMGPLGKLFDKSYDEFYFGCKTFEEAESKLISDAIDILLKKSKLGKLDIDLMIGGDLLNQLTASNYAAKNYPFSFVGIYSACSTSTLGLILGSVMIEYCNLEKIITTVSSHNNAAERQFRYPVEYGGPKPKTSTFTSTGAAAALLSSKKGKIKIESGTIGRVIDSGINDVFNMGGVMAISAANTIYKHLIDTGRSINYYDLVLTGDLGIYGKKILIEYLKKEYDIELINYNDTGTMLYDLDKQPVYAGASGPVCVPLVLYTDIIKKMNSGELNKVLLVATGALQSQTTANEKRTIPTVSHAISLEVA